MGIVDSQQYAGCKADIFCEECKTFEFPVMKSPEKYLKIGGAATGLQVHLGYAGGEGGVAVFRKLRAATKRGDSVIPDRCSKINRKGAKKV